MLKRAAPRAGVVIATMTAAGKALFGVSSPFGGERAA
jgi:hypothetical protein